MKKNYSIVLIMSVLFVFNSVIAQDSVNQLLIGSGGVYGDESDHVSLSSYSPDNGEVDLVGGVITESIQDMVTDGDFAYVAAQDSIAKFDLVNKERVGIIACSNVNQLLLGNGKLFVSRWSSPEDSIFVKVFIANDLSFVADVEGISGDAADLILANDTLYAAVNGGWMGTKGKMAVIDNSFTLKREIDFGTDAIGIFDMFTNESKIYCVNRSPWGATQGSITTYDILTGADTTFIVESNIGKGFDIYDGVLYLLLDGAIASYNLVENVVLNQEIIAATDYTFSAAAYDYINDQFYVAETDYTSYGQGSIFNASGDSIGAFDIDVSTEILLLDYDLDFEYIDYWVGNGQKKAIFIADWNDGITPEALAWGFRWDGTVTGEDMINAIAAADSRLTLEMGAGFLNTLNYSTNYIEHSGIGGEDGYYWATYSGTSDENWIMNSGISTVLSDGDWFGCSYTDFNPAIAPESASPVGDPLAIIENSISFTITPNPAISYTRIEAENLQKIEIYNLQGVKIQEERSDAYTTSIQLNLSNLRSGIYIVKVYTSLGVSAKRFVKK